MKVNVCIVTFPFQLSEAGYTPLSNLAKLFSRLSNRVFVVSGGAAVEKLENLDVDVQTMRVTHRVSSKLLMRITHYIHTQLKILRCLLATSGEADLFVFSIGGEGLILPLLALRLLRKKVILMPGGVATKVYSVRKDPLTGLVSLLISISPALADKLVLYSSRLTKEGKFARYRSKIVIAHEHFVDFNKFAKEKNIDDRSDVVGYVGRLSAEKGILDLVKAVPHVLKKRKVHFVICGQGELAKDVVNLLNIGGVREHAKLVGWVPHQDLPQYLNEMKLLVLPSYTEGLPNVILEAMACGTPVLTTPVGSIPDIIRDDETGFLLSSNDTEYITNKIVELLNDPELLEKVGKSAYNWVRENFSEEKTIRTWQRILDQFRIN